MTGLVERLREDAEPFAEDDTYTQSLLRQAADRIEQLEAALWKIVRCCEEIPSPVFIENIARAALPKDAQP